MPSHYEINPINPYGAYREARMQREDRDAQSARTRLADMYAGNQDQRAQQQSLRQQQEFDANQTAAASAAEEAANKQLLQQSYTQAQRILAAPPGQRKAVADSLFDDEDKAELADNGIDYDTLDDDGIADIASKLENQIGSMLGIAPAKPVVPFDKTDEAEKLRMQQRNAMELERLRQSGQAAADSRNPAAGTAPENKPLPVGALRLQLDAKEALSTTEGVDESLKNIHRQIASGELKLGPLKNLTSTARNATGASDANSIAYQTMKSSLEKLRNDSLRLNKGVQTEGDAQRAWNELFANLNDGKVVMAQLTRIRNINKRAMNLQKDNIAAIDENYGRQSDQADASGGTVIDFGDLP